MIDEGNREALAIEIGISIPSVRVIRVLVPDLLQCPQVAVEVFDYDVFPELGWVRRPGIAPI